jgi:natural product precursor
MKKISLKRVTEILSDKELKNILGGSADDASEDDLGHSMKCYNYTTSCWVDTCPSTRESAEALCKSPHCGGGYGSMSCS